MNEYTAVCCVRGKDQNDRGLLRYADRFPHESRSFVLVTVGNLCMSHRTPCATTIVCIMACFLKDSNQWLEVRRRRVVFEFIPR